LRRLCQVLQDNTQSWGSMTIAIWEYWPVANMFDSTHGDAAEEKG
jgi:hypothetical protein